MTNKEIKEIVLLGNSDKFLTLAKRLFVDASIRSISWRGLDHAYQKSLTSPDLIIVCGYDYASNWYSFKKYMKVNVELPEKYINTIAGLNTIVLYIDTGDDYLPHTCSRYRYAKNSLSVALAQLGSRFRRVVLPVLLDSNGEANIHGGLITRFIFNSLIRLNLIETTSPLALDKIVVQSLEISIFATPLQLTPKLLKYKRSLFFDRVLRFVCG